MTIYELFKNLGQIELTIWNVFILILSVYDIALFIRSVFTKCDNINRLFYLLLFFCCIMYLGGV